MRPQLRRWPHDPQSLNRYAYVLNNPTNFIDPLGLQCEGGLSYGCGLGWIMMEKAVQESRLLSNTNCTVDTEVWPCSFAGNLVQSGAAVRCPNNDCTGVRAEQGPGGTTIITWTGQVSVRTPGGCVTFGPSPQPCNVPSSYQTFTITAGQTVNDVLLSPDAAFVLGTAGRLAEGPVNLAALGTAAVLVGVPAAGEVATSAVGDYLFARGTGLLNSRPVRIGWSWWGNAAWGLGQTYGQEVFRIGIGAYHAFPWYSLWPWQLPGK